MAQGTVHVPELASQVPVKEDKGEIKNNKKKMEATFVILQACVL